jgi:hypothetical protein
MHHSTALAADRFTRVQQHVCTCLRGLNDVQMRTLDQATVKDIFIVMERMLLRIMTKVEVNKLTETFSLEMGLKRFRSAVVERRLNGLATILEYATAMVRYAGQPLARGASYMTPKLLLEWIAEHQVLEDCFSAKKGHPELMKRAHLMSRIFFERQFCITRDVIVSRLRGKQRTIGVFSDRLCASSPRAPC